MQLNNHIIAQTMGKYKRESPRKDLVKYERNLAEYPFFYPGRGKTPTKMEHTFKIKDKNGEEIGEGSITVKNGGGIPGPLEQDLTFVFSKLFEEQGYPERVKFTTYKIAKEIKRSQGGRTRKQIREGVRTIKETNCILKGIGHGPMVSAEIGFNIIDNYSFYDYKDDLKKGIPYTAAKEVNFIRFSNVMREAIIRNHWKLMDSKIYFSLPSGLPRTLYLYLEKKGLWKKHLYSEKIESLANHLGLDMGQEFHRLRETIDKVIGVLEEAKVISCGRDKDKRIFSPYKK